MAITDKNDGFDFSSLLSPYATKNNICAFTKALSENPISSLLLNKSKLNEETLLNCYKDLRPNERDYILFRFDKEEEKLGKSLLHFGGGFYILDPSSAAISYYLAPLLKPNPLVIDLCAAPGGKSIALSLRREDAVIIANDISYKRALEITKNTDRLGLSSIYSLALDPVRLEVEPVFDLVILDAPCSGSGMIRKDSKMKEDWSKEKVDRLLPIQDDLLEKAVSLTKEEGIIAYSTCSLSVEEDEERVAKILKKHPELEMIAVNVSSDILKGRKNIGYHLVPGIYQGEGIYFCFLRKTKGSSYQAHEIKYKKKDDKSRLNVFSYKKNEYLLTRMYDEISKLPFIAPGIKINDDTDHPKCPYDHAYSKVSQSIPTLELETKEALDYVQGNEIRTDSQNKDGLVILTYRGLRLGFGKKRGVRIKNYLPKGLRANLLG